VIRNDAAAVIRLARRDIEVSQDALARASGLAQSTISAIERGTPIKSPEKNRTALRRLGASLPEPRASPAPAAAPEAQTLRGLALGYDLPGDGPVRPHSQLQRAVDQLVADRLNSR